MPTASQIAQGRQTPLTAGLFNAVRDEAPLFSAFDARTTSDTSFLSLAIVSLPSSGFANLNEGFTSSEGQLELREFSCSLIGGLIKAERISADLWDSKNAGSAGYNWFDLQTMLKMKADILHVEKQMIKGRSGNDSKGFPGAKELTPYSGGVFTMSETASKYDFKRSVLDVAGTSADTASSVYSFVFGPTESQLILGNDSGGELVRMGEIHTQMLAPNSAEATKLSEHRVAQVDGYVGLAVSGFNQQLTDQTVPTQYSVRRAANVTADSGKKCTDEVLDKLARSHGTGRRPSLFAMSHRSGEQLAASRQSTAVNYNMGQTGDAARSVANIYPEPPDNWRGIPIVYPSPDVIGDTDAIES
jgi:hypothetical protein